MTAGLPFYDKDTMPLKRPGPSGGIRIVPGGSSIREGAFVAKGVICMPPMFVNIGAYVGEGSLIDSHALVGSCAQIGNRVHISAAAQIGGVLEPVGALPVIVEDDVLVGGNTGIYEGAVIKSRAVIAAGTVLTGSTPVYDLPNSRIIKPESGTAARRAGRRGGRARRTSRERRRRRRLGTVARDAGDREVSRRQDGRADGARGVDPVDPVALARQLIDIDSTTGREGEVAVGARLVSACSRLFSARAAAVRWAHQRHRGLSASHAWCSRRTSIACRRFSRAGSKAICSTAAARAMRRAFWRRRSLPRSGCARTASRASGCCLSPAKSAAATARPRRTRLDRSRSFSSTASRRTIASARRHAVSFASS